MNVIGIIAEYNPFHNGHLYQINKIKELYKDCIIIVVLNGNFTQRGEVSIINKWKKTEILLNNSVDLVVELPIFYGINNSNIFAHGSIEILNNLGINILAFGSEINDINIIRNALHKKNTNEYNNLVKKYLDKGNNYALSSFNALNDLTGIKINTPNNILALSYLEEIVNNKYNIKPLNIKRTNNYHSNNLEKISSASAIRNGIKENKDISIAVPNITLNYLDDIVFIDDYFDLLKYKILSSNNLNIYHDVIEGIDNRIYKYIKESNTLEELISKVKTKRFTYNRIKRILLYILLDIKKDDIKNIKNYIRPLGFNETGKKYLNKIKNNLTLPLINCYSKNKDILSLEYKANLIYSLKTKNINESIKNELNKPIKKQ